jgi:hypothetical protein
VAAYRQATVVSDVWLMLRPVAVVCHQPID